MPRYPCLITGKKDIYPSVTEIISDCTDKSGGLTQWAANQVVEWIRQNCEWPTNYKTKIEPSLIKGTWIVDEEDLNNARFNFREVSQKALDIGSEVHDMIEQYLKTGKELESEHKEANNAFGAFLEWSTVNDLQAVEIEKKVYSDRWAGMLDFEGFYQMKYFIIDWKSSKAHYPEMRYQTAAYRYARTEQLKKEGSKWTPAGNGVLRLDKETGLPDFKDHSKTYKQDLKVFNSMVDLYFNRHKNIRTKFLKNREATK